ncbi:MAG: UbiA family prenyltransferase [Chloroflexota bacterium]
MTELALWFNRLVAILVLSRPRTWSFAVSMFLGAYLSTGAISWGKLLIGAATVAAVTGLTNLFNAYTDQREDMVNLPNRQPMLEAIAFPRLRLWIPAGYVIAICLGAFLGLKFTVVVFVAVADSILYSWGLRFKAHPLLSLVAFSGAVVLPFVAGWVVERSILEISPLVLVLGYFFFAYGNIKNLPDIPGDRQAGLRTMFTIYSFDKSIKLVSGMLLSPYLLLCALIVAGALETKYAPCFLFMPVVCYIIYRTMVAQTREEKEATHALGYFYQLLFFLVALNLYVTHAAMLAGSIVLLVFSITADYFKIDSRPYDLRLDTLLGYRSPPRVRPAND